MFKTALFDCAINEKCCSVDGGRGICPLFLSPPRGIWQLNTPHPQEFAIQGKKMLMPPNSSSRLTLISFTDLLRLRSLPLLSSSVWFSATVLGDNVLTSWRDVTVLERRYSHHYTSPAFSTFTAHQTAFPRQNDFFCREVKRDASAEGISVERLVLQGLFLTLSLNAPSALTF